MIAVISLSVLELPSRPPKSESLVADNRQLCQFRARGFFLTISPHEWVMKYFMLTVVATIGGVALSTIRRRISPAISEAEVEDIRDLLIA